MELRVGKLVDEMIATWSYMSLRALLLLGCLLMTPHPRFSRDKPRFTDTLDVIKFLCKDLWTLVFRKQIDNLKTNHRVSSRCQHSLLVLHLEYSRVAHNNKLFL